MAWPTSPVPHVAEIEENRVSPAVVFATPSVPVERTAGDVPPLVFAPLARMYQVVTSHSRLGGDQKPTHPLVLCLVVVFLVLFGFGFRHRPRSRRDTRQP